MIEVTTATAPAHWASYLVNGDASGFDYYNTPTHAAGDEDKAQCDRWLNRLAEDGWRVVSCEGEPYFARSSDAGVRNCDIIEYVLHRTVNT